MRADKLLLAHCAAAAALFALPACSFHARAEPNLQPGPTPQSSAIFCDIENVGNGPDHTARVCADAAPSEIRQSAIPLTSAALYLNTKQSSMFAVDKSPDAVGRCGRDGEIVEFQGPFPQGTPQCINCTAQIPSTYADANAACTALCEDVSLLPGTALGMTTADIATFCGNHARASTNLPVTGCPMGFEGACGDGGTLLMSFTDPRQFPEPVIWTDLIGVAAGGTGNNDLTRTAAGNGSFDAGAASTQWVSGGDAYVEFSAAETNTAHLIGFATIPPACPFPCTDQDPGTHDVSYGLNLGADGHYYVVLGGVPSTLGPDVNGSFGTYTPGERFRITVIDVGGGLVDVRYSVLIGSCTPGAPCNEQAFFQDVGVPGYPLRVDTSFQFTAATLQNVLLMRIIH